MAIKIDVEGSELNVLKGAQETISAATRIVLTIEAHPKVCHRTGIGPQEFLGFLESVRPFRYSIAETGANITADRVELHPTNILNIVAVSI